MQTTTYHTFNTKGLTDRQIELLAECERRYFAKESVNLDFFKNALNSIGFVKGSEEATQMSEAWDYWKDLRRAYDPDSYLNPVPLSKIFTVTGSEKDFWLNFSSEYKSLQVQPNMEYLNWLEMTLLYEFKPRHYYFSVIEDRLYLQYQQIIGSRYLCNIVNDLV